MPLTSQEVQSKLWQAADILRGQIDSADYKSYIFSMLFLKRLSDRFDEEVANAVTAGVPRAAAVSDPDEHQFAVPETAHWSQIVKAAMNLGEALNVASHEIEDANAGRIDGVLTGTNWNDESKLGSPANRERIIRSLLNHFNDLDLRDTNFASDREGTGNVLGDAYEYLIYQFADDAGKKGGEFYTPRSVVRLIVELLQPKEGMRICDPTFGSAGMLIFAADYVQEQGGNRRNLVLEGQERNLGTFAIGKLNMLLHGLASARLVPGDVIAEPGLVDREGRLQSYDRIIANPPFSMKNWGHDFAPADPHHRFDRYGAVPPRTRGDLAFLLHMLGVTNAQGMVGVVMPHGVLFRGGAEGKIRKGIVDADLFEAIIGLVPNLFFGASIPVSICVLNKAKPVQRRGKVLFVDAAQEGYFRPGKAQNFLDRGHIGRIVEAFQGYEEVERFAHVADLEEIAGNDYNLNISRYVDTTEPLVFGIDETVERRWGRKIAAKGRYRDPVRSTDDQVVMTPGLQWVSLMLLTRIGWAGRHWALPFLTAPVVSARYDRRKGRRHKTVTDYAQQMLVCLRRWLPYRDLVVAADGGYAKREFLRHCQNMSKPIVVVTKLRKDASRYQPAPARRPGQIGRPRVVGARLPSPTAVLDDPATQWIPYRATGSDGSTAMVELASGVALWYHGGPPRLPIRWVVIRYLEERRGPYALLCTDADVAPPETAQERPQGGWRLTTQPMALAVPPVRSTSASSMQSPPASADATRVSILSPAFARPGASARSTWLSTSSRRPK